MTDIDEIVRRTVESVRVMARKAWGFAGLLLLVVTVVCVTGLLLGIAALDGGIETVWVVLAVTFAAIAIGGPAVALWRIWSIQRHTTLLAGEIRQMILDGGEGGRTVIETFDLDDPARPDDGQSAVVLTRRVSGLRGPGGPAMHDAPTMSAAVKALATFPFMVIVSVLISLVFSFLSLIFLIALAL